MVLPRGVSGSQTTGEVGSHSPPTFGLRAPFLPSTFEFLLFDPVLPDVFVLIS